MNPRFHVPDKELQGYMTKWERDVEFFAKATGTQGVTPAQHKMFVLRMCSAGLHTHLGYCKATEASLAVIRQEIANWLHRTLPQGKDGGFAALEEAQGTASPSPPGDNMTDPTWGPRRHSGCWNRIPPAYSWPS